MADNKAEGSALKGVFLFAAACLVVSAGMLVASWYFRDSMQREYQQNHNRFRNASQQYLAVDEEERIIEEFYPQFARLYHGGLLGREQRLSWIETLRHAGEAIRIPEISYKLEVQEDVKPEFNVSLGAYGLFASSMNLNMGLLHEGDLFRLFRALDRDARGTYTVKRCEFVMANTDITLDPNASNIMTECDIDWLTINLKGDQELSL